MSIEINWETLTTGPDGAALAETIREFIHDRFQKVTLPKFIRSVKVHSFDFGTVAPDVEIKDVCDPLPDFYEGEEGDDSVNGDGDGNAAAPSAAPEMVSKPPAPPLNQSSQTTRPARPTVDAVAPGLRSRQSYESQKQPMSPAIPGGTTNFSYFHMPLTPALGGGMHSHMGSVTPHFGGNWPLINQSASSLSGHGRSGMSTEQPPPEEESEDAASDTGEPTANDVQIVSHLRYSGDVRLSLTADILLDYPTTSFVGIPLLLNVTGMTFDGVAILAYIKHKTHFCFLAPDDADALVGGEESGLEDSDDEAGQDSPGRQKPATSHTESGHRKPVGGLFEEIHVESEIGQKTGGKQVLKNVGKVEKFVLEQVRKIFENEFVYPSFWTFLV